MSDPIVDAAPSSTEPSTEDGMATPGEAVSPTATASSISSIAPISTDTSAIATTPAIADAESGSASTTTEQSTGIEPAQAPNAVATAADGAATDVAGEDPNAAAVASEATSGATVSATALANQESEDPNGDVLPVVSHVVDALASSVTPASSSVATEALSASVGDAIRSRIAAIKQHLLGFEEASRQKIHAELAAIKKWL